VHDVELAVLDLGDELLSEVLMKFSDEPLMALRMLDPFVEPMGVFQSFDEPFDVFRSSFAMSTASSESMNPKICGRFEPKCSPISLTKVSTSGPTMTW
jgi:hypothetical protein